MRYMRIMSCISLVLLAAMAACTLGETPPPSQPQSGNTTAVASSSSTQASSSAPLSALFGSGSGSSSSMFNKLFGSSSSTQTAPVELAGPPMKVGSTYLYFDGTTLVAVPGGPFTMGGNGPDNPQHTVTLSDFWIYSTKVTNRQYQGCVVVGKCTPLDATANPLYSDPNHQSNPVVGVNWAQGEAYCEYANGRLPTEAQWEKTARGPNGNLYPWGNDVPSKDLLNYNNTVGATTNVLQYPNGKSYYDALDMEGNAFEWVWDWYDPAYYTTAPTQDPQGPDSSPTGNRSVRSASFRSGDNDVLASTRFYKLPTVDVDDLGFRCVVTNPALFATECQVPAYAPSTPGLSCPQLAISVTQPTCSSPSAVITLTDSAWNGSNSPDPFLALVSPPVSGVSCTPLPAGSHTQSAKCTNIPAGGFDLESQSLCGMANVGCPANYTLDGTSHLCEWAGGGTGSMCPAGQQFNSSQMCCASSSTAGFPACPAGSQVTTQGDITICADPSHPVTASAHVDAVPSDCNNNSCNVGGSCTSSKCPKGGHYNKNCGCECSTGGNSGGKSCNVGGSCTTGGGLHGTYSSSCVCVGAGSVGVQP